MNGSIRYLREDFSEPRITDALYCGFCGRSSPGLPACLDYGCVLYWMYCPPSVMPTASMLRAVRWLLL